VAPLQYRCGDEVYLINPRVNRQKVAVGNISGLPGKHKFHFTDIPETWFKVDVREILQKGVALMFPFHADDQNVIDDVTGTSTVWNQKYLKMTM
jgi:hypothetical protein